jgi:hypothetical protein
VQSRPAPKVRQGFIFGLGALGAMLIALAYLVPETSGWQDTTSSVLLHVGTAVGLAGVLFLIERRFTRAVARVEERVDQRVEAITQPLQTRLADLEDLVQQRVAERSAAQDEAIRSVSENVSFESLAKAFAAANQLNAIGGGSVTVEASTDLNGIRPSLRCGHFVSDFLGPDIPPGEVVIEIQYLLPAAPGQAGRSVVREVWRNGDGADEIGTRLVERLQAVGAGRGARSFEWAVTLGNVQRALDIAVRSRRHDQGAWHLEGALFELVGDEWALTERGIESRSRGLVLEHSAFPERPMRTADRFDEHGQLKPPWVPPKAPEGVPLETWDVLIERGKEWFPRPFMVAIYQSDFVPYRGQAQQE